ncbi:MAG: ribosome biogenesis GTP-binding protein YihA/YsxC [Desulfobacca sp.]|uniref:ribosome biogenesis GTP-binding protein YihA/YsxC n=1 Tax=Desulfobacca sp. TaxID=2067990 RepID=UPI00404AD13E
MAIPKIQTAQFLLSTSRPEAFPAPRLPEVAFWGRSNVGKSSLINTLLHRKGLVRTSSRPGCTQTINFFLVNNNWHFVDLPGYGYAQVPVAVKDRWLRLITVYLQERANLRAIVLLLDCRRSPGPEEVEIIANLQGWGRQVILVLTKADKLNRSQRQRQRQAITASLAPSGLTDCIWFSALTHEGRRELWERLMAVL